MRHPMTPKIMTRPDPSAVATLAGRELDAAVAEMVMGESVFRFDCGPGLPCQYRYADLDLVVAYSADRDPSFFDLLAKVRENGWDVELNAMGQIAPICHVELSCSRGPCERHGNTEEDAHFVRAIGDTLNVALARAALLTTYPADDVRRLKS